MKTEYFVFDYVDMNSLIKFGKALSFMLFRKNNKKIIIGFSNNSKSSFASKLIAVGVQSMNTDVLLCKKCYPAIISQMIITHKISGGIYVFFCKNKIKIIVFNGMGFLIPKEQNDQLKYIIKTYNLKNLKCGKTLWLKTKKNTKIHNFFFNQTKTHLYLKEFDFENAIKQILKNSNAIAVAFYHSVSKKIIALAENLGYQVFINKKQYDIVTFMLEHNCEIGFCSKNCFVDFSHSKYPDAIHYYKKIKQAFLLA